MSKLFFNSYPDIIDSNFTYPTISTQTPTMQKIQGGYVEFSLLEETYVHFFTSSQELSSLEKSLQMGKPLKGLRQYIKQYYAPQILGKQIVDDEQIIIWN